jgi:hypothetical protein
MARAAGRRAVSTRFFGFLDDDDELLEGAITRHLLNFEAFPSLDVSVCNGFKQFGGNYELLLDSTAGIDSDPLRALFHRNYLASCGGLFREATVGSEFFEELPPFGQWTMLAFSLAMSGKQIRMVSDPGYVIHDSPVSQSKGIAYKANYLTLFERMRQMQPPDDIIEILHNKTSDTLHDLSVEMLTAGNLREAVRLHVKSLRPIYGLRYLSYTRRLVMHAFTRVGLKP